MPEPAGGHLLVAEDNPVLRRVLGRYLEQQGHTVAYAENGRQALDLLHAQTFEMVLLDIEMPEVDGYQVLQQVIADPRLRDIPVIVTSALEEMDNVVRCIEMGAEDYLFKPVNQVLLKARIGASLEKKRLRDRQTGLLNRLEREMEIARQAQRSILPNQLPQAEGYDFGALMAPALAVGGDFYEFIDLPDGRLGMVIGDVSDKGLPAALFMALTYSLVRVEAARGGTPRQVLLSVNRLLREMNSSEIFVTLFYGILDFHTGSLAYARAGHPAPVVIQYDRQPLEISIQTGQPLGVFAEPLIDEQNLAILPGSTVLIYSDGLSEAADRQGTQFGVKGLVNVSADYLESPAQEICQQLWKAVTSHIGDSPQQDDFTIVAIKKTRITPEPRLI